MPRKLDHVMLPFNGHYWMFDKWADQIETMINAGKIYHSNTACPISTREKKEVLKALAKRCSERGK